jgi:hypothetical protein
MEEITMSKMVEEAARQEQEQEEIGSAGAVTMQVYRVRSVQGETLIAVPREYEGKVLAREVNKDGRIIFSPIRVVCGNNILET